MFVVVLEVFGAEAILEMCLGLFWQCVQSNLGGVFGVILQMYLGPSWRCGWL